MIPNPMSAVPATSFSLAHREITDVIDNTGKAREIFVDEMILLRSFGYFDAFEPPIP